MNVLNRLIAASFFFVLVSSSAWAQSGYNSLFIGHSFFVPFAYGMPLYTAQAGITDHTQTVVFSGGASGAPQALWEDAAHAAEIKAVLDVGDVELFAMTYAGEYPTTEGYINWINYALDKNPNTRIAVAMPWIDFPAIYNATDYANTLNLSHDVVWRNFIAELSALYPTTDIFSIPHGLAAVELRLLFDANNLPDIDFLTGDKSNSLFVDTKGHAGDMLKALGRLIWLGVIYDVDLASLDYDLGYTTDLKAIAQTIIDDAAADISDVSVPSIPLLGLPFLAALLVVVRAIAVKARIT
ncbi:MAG: hypothetical protein P8J42_06990 [Pseudomonadales bacterium]|nr:hypothetical protein [Pseudomonadales bacterium]